MNQLYKDTIHYLALGDSYTIGEGVASSERWPVLLAGRLETGSGRPVVTSIIARTGWTTDELITGIEAKKPVGKYDLVSLLIGVNNQYRGRDTAEYRIQLRELLGRAIEFAGQSPSRVFVLSIPDWGVTPFAEGRDRNKIAVEIDRFNEIKKEKALRSGVSFFNITDISRQAKDDPGLVAQDGLHPSPGMYEAWVERILPSVIAILNEK